MAAAALSLRRRSRGSSLSAVTPPVQSREYDTVYASLASRILYRSPLPSRDDLPVFILDSAALPDSNEVHYSSLLPYVLARLPTEEQLIGGKGYEVVFFAGGEADTSGRPKKSRPQWTWFLQAYQALSRAMRKRLQKLYIVHERGWTKLVMKMFSTVISPKFGRKIFHCSTLSALGLHIPIEDLLIPPSAYDRDRRRERNIFVPYATGRRAFGARNPLPTSTDGSLRLPRVLRETSVFLLQDQNAKTEGIFRINARAQSLEILREAYDRGQKFIIWKEQDIVMCASHWQEGHGETTVDEIVQRDGYSAYTAAGLIKLWYSKQAQPLIPEDAYSNIEASFGISGSCTSIEEQPLINLLSPLSESSPLPNLSRVILSIHLFPLLSRLAAFSAENKMTAANLAVCFAPALLCGTDPIRDAKVSQILVKILQYGIENWDTSLATAFGTTESAFDDLLQTPSSIPDREDPLETEASLSASGRDGEYGIAMLNNDDTDSSEELEKPPLPPRILPASEAVVAEPVTVAAAAAVTGSSPTYVLSPIHRKPVPASGTPPKQPVGTEHTAELAESHIARTSTEQREAEDADLTGLSDQVASKLTVETGPNAAAVEERRVPIGHGE